MIESLVCCVRRPLAPGTYNVTAALAGYANETVTVVIPADGSGESVEIFMGRAGGAEAVTNWGLAHKFGPLREGPPGPVRAAIQNCPPIVWI